MRLNASVYIDKYGSKNIVLFDNGIAHPLIILSKLEALDLIKELLKELDIDGYDLDDS